MERKMNYLQRKTFVCVTIILISLGMSNKILSKEFRRFGGGIQQSFLYSIVKIEGKYGPTSGLIIGYTDSEINILASLKGISGREIIPIQFYRKPTYRMEAKVFYRDFDSGIALLKIDAQEFEFFEPLITLIPTEIKGKEEIYIIGFKGYKEWSIETSNAFQNDSSNVFKILTRSTFNEPGLFIFNREFQLLGMTLGRELAVRIDSVLDSFLSKHSNKNIPLNNLKIVNKRYAYRFSKMPPINTREDLMLEVQGRIRIRDGNPKIFVEVFTYVGSFRQAVSIIYDSFTTNKFFLGTSSIYEIENIFITTESSEKDMGECVQIHGISWRFIYPPNETHEINGLEKSFSLSPDPRKASPNCEATTNRLSLLKPYK